jgi:hypothetical protein
MLMDNAIDSIYSNIQRLIRMYYMPRNVMEASEVWLEVVSRAASLYIRFRNCHKNRR